MEKRTIGQAAELYGLEKRTFQKRLETALNSPKKRDIFRQYFPDGAPENTGVNDIFTPEMRAFLDAFRDGKTDKKNGAVSVSVPVPAVKIAQSAKTERPEKTDTLPPVSVSEPVRKYSDVVFSSEILLLFALSVLIFSDGWCMSILAGRAISGSLVTTSIFGVVGVVIGYASIRNAWALSAKERKSWEPDRVVQWAIVFAFFQAALHGAAFELFGEWSGVVGRVLICGSIPLGTASLTVTMLSKPSK